jgi:esterase/lipase
LVAYFLGPTPSTPKYELSLPVVPIEANQLEEYIALNEAKHKIKPDNEARIVWADSSKTKTPIAIVYIHGFSASQEEGNPVHRRLAKSFGCNLFLSRLSQHGIDTVDNMLNLTVDNYWESVKEAYAIGKSLGDKVLLVGCSTGGTFNLILASEYSDVFGIINMSPNVEIRDPNAKILNNPWGLQIARIVVGGKNKISEDQREIFKKYWHSSFRLESAVQLQELIETKMTDETFRKINQPILNMYFYKNEMEQDDLVKVESIKTMHQKIATLENLKTLVQMETVGNHVMGSPIKSKDIDAVYNEMEKFCIEKLRMKKI